MERNFLSPLYGQPSGPIPVLVSKSCAFAEIDDKGGQVLVRATKPFAPVALNTTSLQQSDFANQTVLLRSPYQISFAYAGPDKVWKKNWQNANHYQQPFD